MWVSQLSNNTYYVHNIILILILYRSPSMVTGGALASDDNSTVLCYWTPADHNWHEVGCCICWGAWRNGWIQACTWRFFSRTEYIGCSGKVKKQPGTCFVMFSSLKVLLPWMVPLFVLWSHSKTNGHKSFSTTTSNIRFAILKLLFCQTIKVSCLTSCNSCVDCSFVFMSSFSSQC